MSLVDDLKWRYAAKKMDATAQVSDHDIAYIKEAVQLAASSYGLQPYTVLQVTNPSVRAELRPLCWQQSQITDASHLFIFCNHTKVSAGDIDDFIKLKAEISGVAAEELVGYGDFVKRKVSEKSAADMVSWTAKQAYIALGNALAACAERCIDSTPIEGFQTEAVNDLLQLESQGLNAAVLLAVGFRDAEDKQQYAKKVRKPLSKIFKEV
jgi:nitroreductase/dihydropteridine reductase